MQDTSVHEQDPFVWFFLGLQTFGCIGTSAILCTVLASRHVHRYPTWINLAVSWILWALSYDMLFIAGQQPKEVPDYVLCLTQAALVYATPVLCAFTTVALVIQIWQHASTLCGVKCFKLPTIFLLVAPYALALLTIAEVLVIGIKMPWTVRKEMDLYCGIINGIPGKVSCALSLLAMIVTLIFEGLTVRMLFRNWHLFRSVESTSANNYSLGMVVRVVLFSFSGVLSIIVCSFFISDAVHALNAANIAVAMMQVIFILIFGTQKDLWKVWVFWKTNSAGSQTLRNVRSSAESLPNLKDSEAAK